MNPEQHQSFPGSLSQRGCNGQVYYEIVAEVWDELKETYDKIDGFVFLMSNLLAREPIPDVKEDFNIVFKEESHKGLHLSSGLSKAHRDASTSTGSTTFDNAFTKEQTMKIMSLINEKLTRNANASMVGANQHLTVSTKNMFNVIDISSLNVIVGQPNGTLAKIIIVGNLRLSANIVFFDVLIVPEYCVSLLYVHKLIKDSKLFVGFDEHVCYIQDLNLIKIVRIDNEFGGLYMFDEDKNGKSKCGMSNYVFVCHVSKALWHCRLGHPSDQVLSVLSKNIGLKYDKHVSPCDICHKAKQTRDPFSLSNHKSVTVGDLVHLDLVSFSKKNLHTSPPPSSLYFPAPPHLSGQLRPAAGIISTPPSPSIPRHHPTTTTNIISSPSSPRLPHHRDLHQPHPSSLPHLNRHQPPCTIIVTTHQHHQSPLSSTVAPPSRHPLHQSPSDLIHHYTATTPREQLHDNTHNKGALGWVFCE
nr:ribonuclease H-like domain-containing protein [Tanacetum cinerariifolium]